MKITKNIFVDWLLMLIFSTNFAIFAQKDFPTIKAGKVYQQSGVTITSPNEPDWKIVKREKTEIVFLKMNTERKFNAFVKRIKIDVYENVKDLFATLENLKKAEVSEVIRDSIHYNWTEFKDTPCLQYDGIFNNDGEYKYFNMSGYLCRHPQDKSVAIQIEFSSYSNNRGYTETEVKLSKNFFEKIVFSKFLK